MNEGMNEWMDVCMNEWMKEWMNEWMNEWRDQWMNEWTCEYFIAEMCLDNLSSGGGGVQKKVTNYVFLIDYFYIANLFNSKG